MALQRSANKLAQDLRRAQEMAMSAKKCPIDKCGGPPAIVPPRYGIELNKNSDNYFLFADLNDPDGSGRYEEIPDVKIETMYVEKGVEISELWTHDSKEEAWVTFKPPDPLTTIRDPGERSTIEIRLKAGEKIKKVIINQAGLIYVE